MGGQNASHLIFIQVSRRETKFLNPVVLYCGPLHRQTPHLFIFGERNPSLLTNKGQPFMVWSFPANRKVSVMPLDFYASLFKDLLNRLAIAEAFLDIDN